MYIRNVESAINNDNLFFCKSFKLMKFLRMSNIYYVNRKIENSRLVWIFLKTPQLESALFEWEVKM